MSASIGIRIAGCAAVLLASISPLLHAASPGDTIAARLQRLEDREQILELLTAYGATLDRHDFAAFGRLFAEDTATGCSSGV
jgi:hypothetical protein